MKALYLFGFAVAVIGIIISVALLFIGSYITGAICLVLNIISTNLYIKSWDHYMN